MGRSPVTPQDREASDFINSLKTLLPEYNPDATTDVEGQIHTRALIWLINRVDQNSPFGVLGALVQIAKASPLAMVSLCALAAIWILAAVVTTGTLPSLLQ